MRSRQVGEQSRPELLALPGAPEPPGAAYRASLEEDAGSLSGESLDGHLQGEWGPLPFLSRPGSPSTDRRPLSAAAGPCPRLTPPPSAAPDVALGLPPHGLWSRHILQQTLMDEGLRLARLVSHERVGRLSPCLPGKPPAPGEPPWGCGGGGRGVPVGPQLPSPPRQRRPDAASLLCLPAEFEDGLAERGPPAPPDPPRGTIKVEQETSRQ